METVFSNILFLLMGAMIGLGVYLFFRERGPSVFSPGPIGLNTSRSLNQYAELVLKARTLTDDKPLKVLYRVKGHELREALVFPSELENWLYAQHMSTRRFELVFCDPYSKQGFVHVSSNDSIDK